MSSTPIYAALLCCLAVALCTTGTNVWKTDYWPTHKFMDKGWKEVTVPKNTYMVFGIEAPSSKAARIDVTAISGDAIVSWLSTAVPFESIIDMASDQETVPKGQTKMYHFSPPRFNDPGALTTGYVVVTAPAHVDHVKIKFRADLVAVSVVHFSESQTKSVKVSIGDGDNTSDVGYFAIVIDKNADLARHVQLTFPADQNILNNVKLSDYDARLSVAFTVTENPYHLDLWPDSEMIFGRIENNPNKDITVQIKMSFTTPAQIVTLAPNTPTTIKFDTYDEFFVRIDVPDDGHGSELFTSYAFLQFSDLTFANAVAYSFTRCVPSDNAANGQCTTLLPYPTDKPDLIPTKAMTVALDGSKRNHEPLETGLYWLHLIDRSPALLDVELSVEVVFDVCDLHKAGPTCNLPIIPLDMKDSAAAHITPANDQAAMVYHLKYNPTHKASINLYFLLDPTKPDPFNLGDFADFVIARYPLDVPDPEGTYPGLFKSVRLEQGTTDKEITIVPYDFTYGHDGDIFITVFTTVPIDFKSIANYQLDCHGHGQVDTDVGNCQCHSGYSPKFDCGMIQTNRHELETNGTTTFTVQPGDTVVTEFAANPRGKPVNLEVSTKQHISALARGVLLRRIDYLGLDEAMHAGSFRTSPDDTIRYLLPTPQAPGLPDHPKDVHYRLEMSNYGLDEPCTFIVQPLIDVDHTPTARGLFGLVVEFITFVVLPFTALMIVGGVVFVFVAGIVAVAFIYVTGFYKHIFAFLAEQLNALKEGREGGAGDVDDEYVPLTTGDDEPTVAFQAASNEFDSLL